MARMTAEIVLIDIDGTVTEGILPGRPFMDALQNLVAAKQGIPVEEALALIRKNFDADRESVITKLGRLGVSKDEYWRALMPGVRRHYRPFPDAIEMVRALRKRGFRLYTATTNSRLVCLAKLSLANLANRNGSVYFRDVFGGSEVCPQGKSGPAFYTALLKRIGAAPDEVVMVGDSPEADLAYALAAGIRKVILPRRRQEAEWVRESDGGLYVQSLARVPDMLARP